MINIWSRLVRWLAREHLAYLEYENKELRYENELWRHRFDGAMEAVRVFERRYRFMEENIADAALLRSPAPIIMERKP